MPIISRIGSRNWKVRLIYAAIFGVLTVGAASMIYPFALMVSGSFNSDADAIYITPYPRFWAEDAVLWQKYVESKYNQNVEYAEAAWGKLIGSWRDQNRMQMPLEKPAYVEEFIEWRGGANGWFLGHTAVGWLYPINGRLWRQRMYDKFDGDIDAFRRAYGRPVKVWNAVRPPPLSGVRFPILDDPYRVEWKKFADARPAEDRVITTLDGTFMRWFLIPRYTMNIQEYNRTHGTDYTDYQQVFLSTNVPPGGQAAVDDWLDFVGREFSAKEPGRGDATTAPTTSQSTTTAPIVRSAPVRASESPDLPTPRMDSLRVGDANEKEFRKYLVTRHGDIKGLNDRYKTDFKDFDAIVRSDMVQFKEDWHSFIGGRFREYLKQRHGQKREEGRGKILVFFSLLPSPFYDLPSPISLAPSRTTGHPAAIDNLNTAYGTHYVSFDKVPFLAVIREDWEEFIRENLGVNAIRLKEDLAQNYKEFLARRYDGKLAELNQAYKAHYKSFEDVPFSTELPKDQTQWRDWESFIKDRVACRADKLSVHGARQDFEEFLAKKLGGTVEELFPDDPGRLPVSKELAVGGGQWTAGSESQPSTAHSQPSTANGPPLTADAALRGPVSLPVQYADYLDCMKNKSEIRKELSTRNYKHVLEYVLLHGRGIMNTLILVVLAIACTLVVNPLAAYALSRYKPRSTYKILLFCMATMAFPGEVTMIPAFLLMRRFPLWPLVAGFATFFVVWWLLGVIDRRLVGRTPETRGGDTQRGRRGDSQSAAFSLPLSPSPLSASSSSERLPEMVRMLVSVCAAIVVGTLVVPAVMGVNSNVSLLNSFAALVLPGVANGFGIFLLKGFFDSLPAELYEAASLDGASEWTKFWTITMSLSKPILAVMTLDAFTGAYSAFMQALIVTPDQNMWTLMVWIFQLQSSAHQAVVYASLVLAAIPTLLVFTLCQNIIIRGIVVPTEK